MKNIFTLLFAALSFSAFSQNNAIHVYPWNPDANQNNSIGTDDLLPFLSVFGEEFGLPPEPCTYDGTPLEELMVGITDGNIILDSIFIEYELQDFSTFYIVGCPEPITDTLIFSTSTLLSSMTFSSAYWQISGFPNGSQVSIRFNYNTSNGKYDFNFVNYAIYDLGFTNDGFFGDFAPSSDNTSIPFPEDWYLDEDGIHIESGWDENEWPYYANYMHILPYWHYADE